MVFRDQSLKMNSYCWIEKITGGKDENIDRYSSSITDFAGFGL